MKFTPKLCGKRADQKHVKNRSRLVSAPGANYYDGCQTSNVWRRNMPRSRESRPRGSRTGSSFSLLLWQIRGHLLNSNARGDRFPSLMDRQTPPQTLAGIGQKTQARTNN